MVTKKDYRIFFTNKKFHILTEEEFDAISNDCSFSIALPEGNERNVIVTIKTDAVLPQKIFDKLINNNIPKLKIQVFSKNLSSDYSQIHNYITSFLNTFHPNEYTLKEMLADNNIEIKDGTIFIKYVIQSEKSAVETVEKELLLYLSKVNFNVNKVEYVLNPFNVQIIIDNHCYVIKTIIIKTISSKGYWHT